MSIEKKLTYLKDTKALIRKKLNRFGINVSSENTFRSYVDFLDEILNRYPKSRGQGTSITLENTIEAQFTEFDEEGNSTQETTDGRQLLKYPYVATTTTVNGVTFTDNGDGSLKINGTASEEARFNLQWDNKVPAGSYSYIVFNLPNNCFANYYTIGNKYGEDVGNRTSDTEINLGSSIVVPAGVTVSNVTVYPMLVSGTYTRETIPNWEKYTGGIASPNPNYEQPIYSAGDNENILPANNGSETIDGVNFTKNSDGTIIANGTATTGINYYINGLDYENIPAGEYTLSDGLGTSGGESSNTFFTFLDGGPNSNSTISLPTFTLSQATNVRGRIVIRSGVTLDNVVFKPKLEKGNKATPYSPHGMGSINEKILNKNFWSLNSSYSSTGYATLLNQANFKLKKGNYILSFEKVTVTSSILFRFFNKDKSSYYDARVTPTSKTPILNALEDIYYVTLIFNEADSLEGIQLEPGSTATPYVPHKEQDYSIFVQQPRRSIGDVRDLFFKNTVDSPYYDENLTLNGWYERHYIGEVVLNGTENIARELISNNFYKFYINNIENVDYGDANYVPQILCNKLIAVARTPLYLNTQGISSGNGNLQIYTDETKNMTVSEFKTWLENNNLIVNYLKTIPIDLPCTETQIQQIENKPSTYKDFTIIQSEDETPAYLEVAGLKED